MHQQILLASRATPTGPTWNSRVAALPALWGWWKLDETAAAALTAPDSSGNGRNGTYTAAGTQSAGLYAGSTVAQNTIGGRVSIPTFTIPNPQKFTLAAFVRANSTPVQSIIGADFNTGGSRIWQFRRASPSGFVQFVTITPATTTTSGATSINDGNPHFVVAVFDQTLAAASGRVKIYVDGALDGQSTTAITITAGLSRVPAIGARSDMDNSDLWTGAIDECFICEDAITSTDVANLWASRNS